MTGVLSLLQSRKFWLALIAAVVAGILFVRGEITAEQFANALVALGGILVAAIAVEDAAEKHSSGETTATGNLVQAPLERTPSKKKDPSR